MSTIKDRWRDAKIRLMMRVPGVMDDYDGFMHAFHDIPVEGCGSSKHSGRAHENGLRRGREHPEKPARDEAERRWREWTPKTSAPEAEKE